MVLGLFWILQMFVLSFVRCEKDQELKAAIDGALKRLDLRQAQRLLSETAFRSCFLLFLVG